MDWILSLLDWHSTPTYRPTFVYGGCDTPMSFLFLECYL